MAANEFGEGRQELVMEKITVTANGRKLEGVWTIEEMQDVVSTMGASVYEELDPEFHAKIVEMLGHDCYFHKMENGRQSICVGDPLGEYILREYPMVDGAIDSDIMFRPLLEEQIEEFLGDDIDFEYEIVGDVVRVTNDKYPGVTEEYKIENDELVKPTCPYCRGPIECLQTYWVDHDTCDND